MPIRSRPHALCPPDMTERTRLQHGDVATTASVSGRVFIPDQSASGKRDSWPRDIPPKIAFRPETVSAETGTQPQEPANCGLLGRLREISRLGRVSGGPERTRTACQAPSQRQTAEMTLKLPPVDANGFALYAPIRNWLRC